MSNQDNQTNLISPPQENKDESDQKAQLPQSYKFTLISQLTRKTYKGTEHPSKRWGHSVIIHNKSMVIFGGHHSQRTLSNIYSLDFRTLNWSKIEQIGASPPARDSHSAIMYNNEMIIFGGTGSENNKYNDLWAFNFTNKRWTKKTTYGNDIPCKRDGHYSSLIYDRYMVVFGGINELDAVIGTVHLLDLTNDFWILTKNEGEQMSQRDSQGGTTINNTLYIFGGQKNSNEDIYYNDMYEANFEINDQDKKYKTIWKKVIPAENSPLPPERASHTCVSYKDRFIIIIGGEGKKSQPLNDIWIFDTVTKYYSEATISIHETFDSRLCHSSILYNDIIAMYGGIQNKDTTLDSLVLLEIESLSGNNAVNLANTCKENINLLFFSRCQFY